MSKKDCNYIRPMKFRSQTPMSLKKRRQKSENCIFRAEDRIVYRLALNLSNSILQFFDSI
jgi:hypothetical protein